MEQPAYQLQWTPIRGYVYTRINIAIVCNDYVLQIQYVKEILPYHELMTPKWLHQYAYITGNYSLYPQYLELDPTTVLKQPKLQQAIDVKLVPYGILSSTDNVAVTVTVAMDTGLANSGDHDPSFGISDGYSFIGFRAHDPTNYAKLSPCRHIEGEIIDGLLQNLKHVKGPLVSSQTFSSEIKLQFRSAEQWGSCHTEHNEGYVNIANYQYKLDLAKGLHLQMYHEDDVETYRIKYIVVDVHVY